MRIRQNREFFNVAPQVALDIFKDIALAIDDADITEYSDNKPIEDKRTKPDDGGQPEPYIVPRRSKFKFSMIGVQIGDFVTFTPTGIKVKVASDDSVEHEGRIYKLSPFVGTFMPEERRNTSGAYQGPKYFSYRGKILNDMRKEMENTPSEMD